MSFDSCRRRSPARSLALGFGLAATLLLATGCGHKKAPKPPPSKIPQKVDLKVHQRGHEAVARFAFPTTTISGTLLSGVSKIELWRYAVEVPEFAIEILAQEAARREEAQELLDELGLGLYETPAPIDPALQTDPTQQTGTQVGEGGEEPGGEEPGDAETPTDPPAEIDDDEAADATLEDPAATEEGEEEDEELSPEEEQARMVEAARALLLSPPTPKDSFITATSKDFASGAEVVLSVEGEEVQRALVGDSIFLRVPLPPRPSDGPEIGYLFAVRVFPLTGKPSDFSSLRPILPVDTPPAPRDLVVEAGPAGIEIRWSAEEDPEGGFRIYRRDAQTRLYGEPVGILPLGTERLYLDRQAIFGARYIYGMTAVESTSPLLEGDLSSEHEIDYQDRFGPARPGGLVAFPEVGRVRLLWTAVADADVAGYEVSRRGADDDEATPLTGELVARGQYLDESVASGDVWFYSVVAVDASGNRSEPSAETEVRVP